MERRDVRRMRCKPAAEEKIKEIPPDLGSEENVENGIGKALS